MAEPIHDPILGVLRWDERCEYWVGEIDLPIAGRVEVALCPDGDLGKLKVLLDAAYGAVAWLQENFGGIQLTVSQEAVELYNSAWAEHGPMSAEEFAALLELGNVGIMEDGRVFLDYFDGGYDLFSGHLLVADFTWDRRLDRIHLEG